MHHAGSQETILLARTNCYWKYVFYSYL